MQPERLGTYLIELELGRGGMGVVYRARDVQTDQIVAIKVLPAELAREPGFADRFAHEVAALQKLDHPNIVKLIEPGEYAGYQYYVMEFVPGTSVHKMLTDERRLPWPQVVELGVQMCRGLKHAHDHGVIHRDLKPSNLLVTDTGMLKLTDFGVAKIFAGTQLTATGGIIGTAEYMSPEQGEGKPVTRRSDLYSLGVVLYTMLTGRTPFIGRSLAELVNQHRFGQFDRPVAVVPEIPPWLDELVCELLEKDPAKRPADARVVERRVEAALRKDAMRSSATLAGQEVTVDSGTGRRRRGMGPATLMQRLMRAQLQELDRPGWLGRLFQNTWVLALALLVAAGSLTLFAMSSGEKRRWKAIEKLAAGGDERDLGLLADRLNDYLRRFENGPHAEEARNMLPQVQRDQQRREFARLDVVKQFRPGPDPPSELERLYRKALIQTWTEGEPAARATLEEIVARDNVPAQDQFLVELAREDLLSLDLQRAETLRDSGQISQARDILQQLIAQHSAVPRHRRWVQLARQALDALPPERTTASSDGD